MREKILLIDIECILYQCLSDCSIEELNDREEYVWKVPKNVVWDAIKFRIQSIQKSTETKRFIIFLGSPNNFRKKIFPEYKSERDKKPLGYIGVCKLLKETFEVVQIPFLEADDAIGLYATTPGVIENKTICVVVSEDKDMKTIPGYHYNYRDPEAGIFTIKREEARVNHLIQALTGDHIDGYHGIKGIGPVKAKKILSHGPTWANVLSVYKKNGYTRDEALLNARLAFILQHPYYNFQSKEISLWEPKHRGGFS